MESDYIIVGGGSAGCVVAARLSEDPGVTVTLLEASSQGATLWRDIPGVTKLLMGNPRFDWLYTAEPDASVADRRLFWHAGKMMGGGSAINGMVYIRGRRSDFDHWAELGCAGWGWDDVEPYFRKAESHLDGDSAVLGRKGPQPVASMRAPHPLAEKFVEASRAVGLHPIEDHSAGEGEGTFLALGSQKNGMRMSTARSYLTHAQKRANFRLIQGAMVDRVLIEDGRATGVVYIRDGVEVVVKARHEIIISGGTIQSPLVLMRSGIGPVETLRKFDIPVQVAAGQVGRNLQEHVGFTVPKFVSIPTYNSDMTPLRGLRHVANFLLFRKGPLASPSVQAMAWVRSSPEQAVPDLQLSWLPFAMDVDARPPAMHTRPCIALGAVVGRPHARGEITLRDRAASSPPLIRFSMLGDERDVRALINGVRLVERIYAASPLADYIVDNAPPFHPDMDDQAIITTLRAHTRTGLHCVGSCRMGADDDAVVDTQLRVRGVAGLRVIDASIIPRQISANTNASCIMIGEKGADMIRAAIGK